MADTWMKLCSQTEKIIHQHDSIGCDRFHDLLNSRAWRQVNHHKIQMVKLKTNTIFMNHDKNSTMTTN